MEHQAMKQFDPATATPERPVIGLHDEYPAGYRDPPHAHDRAQLLYASAGVMSVTVERTTFVVPPQRAVWVPSSMLHDVSCRGPVSLRTLYIDEAATQTQDWTCRVIEISDFLKALILEIARFEGSDEVTRREIRIAELIIDELKHMPEAPFSAAMPTDPRLQRVCRQLIEDPSLKLTLDDLARHAGMGRRTFTRLFRAETGVGVGAWRQQVRLMEALSMLSLGTPVTTVAYHVGYESPSAFTSLFHRFFGVPPSHYLHRPTRD